MRNDTGKSQLRHGGTRIEAGMKDTKTVWTKLRYERSLISLNVYYFKFAVTGETHPQQRTNGCSSWSSLTFYFYLLLIRIDLLPAPQFYWCHKGEGALQYTIALLLPLSPRKWKANGTFVLDVSSSRRKGFESLWGEIEKVAGSLPWTMTAPLPPLLQLTGD